MAWPVFRTIALPNQVRFLVFLVCLSGCVTGCSPGAPREVPPPYQTFELRSEILNESRTINIYNSAPPESGIVPQTMVYMLDGGIHEDFPHIANTLDALVRSQQIEPIILVGIANTDRKRDLTFASSIPADLEIAPTSGGAENFRRFLREELKPEIARRFPAPATTAIIGESLAGLFIVDSFLREPQLFDRYIAIDPSLWWGKHQLIDQAESTLRQMNLESPKHLWLAASNATDILPFVERLAEILDLVKPNQLQWTYLPKANEKHSTIFRAVKEDALRTVLGPKRQKP